MITTAFAPGTPPSLQVFQLGTLLLNGVVAEAKTAPRRFRVRPSIDADHPAIADSRNEALRRGFKKWSQSITIIELRTGRKWIFAECSASFPGYIDSDAHALARLAANERAKEKLRLRGVQC